MSQIVMVSYGLRPAADLDMCKFGDVFTTAAMCSHFLTIRSRVVGFLGVHTRTIELHTGELFLNVRLFHFIKCFQASHWQTGERKWLRWLSGRSTGASHIAAYIGTYQVSYTYAAHTDTYVFGTYHRCVHILPKSYPGKRLRLESGRDKRQVSGATKPPVLSSKTDPPETRQPKAQTSMSHMPTGKVAESQIVMAFSGPD